MAKAPKNAAEAPAADVQTPIQPGAAAAAEATSAAPPPAPPPVPEPEVPPAPKVDPVSLPAKIRMLAPHGFIDETGEHGEIGKHHYWQQSQVVFEPKDIALLHERGANFEAVEDAPAKQ